MLDLVTDGTERGAGQFLAKSVNYGFKVAREADPGRAFSCTFRYEEMCRNEWGESCCPTSTSILAGTQVRMSWMDRATQ